MVFKNNKICQILNFFQNKLNIIKSAELKIKPEFLEFFLIYIKNRKPIYKIQRILDYLEYLIYIMFYLRKNNAKFLFITTNKNLEILVKNIAKSCAQAYMIPRYYFNGMITNFYEIRYHKYTRLGQDKLIQKQLPEVVIFLDIENGGFSQNLIKECVATNRPILGLLSEDYNLTKNIVYPFIGGNVKDLKLVAYLGYYISYLINLFNKDTI